MHVRWPKFQNIHRLIAEEEIDEGQIFLACEKIDGSNLGLEVEVEHGLVAIHGRNCTLWEQGDESSALDRTYGCVKGTLRPIESLVPKLKELANLVLEEEPASTKSVIFYGEWFRCADASEGSWHPFGYSFRCLEDGGQTNRFRTMTLERHKLFCEHGFDPPKILFSGGTLYELVDALFSKMMEPGPGFEGVFITSESGGTRNCAKWKTGLFEEQTSFVIPQGMEHSEKMTNAVEKLRQVFESKGNRVAKVRVAKKKKVDLVPRTAEEEAVDHQICLAFHSVLSKSPHSAEQIRGMDRVSLANELKRLNAEVLEDVSETYAASGLAVPKEVKKRVGKTVADHVMKGKPLLVGAEAEDEKKEVL